MMGRTQIIQVVQPAPPSRATDCDAQPEQAVLAMEPVQEPDEGSVVLPSSDVVHTSPKSHWSRTSI